VTASTVRPGSCRHEEPRPDLELPLAEQRLRLVAREADDFHWYDGHLRSA
jgi:hypothetical protein